MKQWSWILRRIVQQIWFRAALISAAGVALAILAAIITPYLPYSFAIEIGQKSVGTILEIMASSMLAVTTFSLTAMVSAYSSATQLATPRATQLMVSDPTSQNALSTFLGAFVFSMIGIIGLNTGAYGNSGRIILFAATVAIVLLVVGTLLRWIGHITAFGRMADVIDRVENAATRAMTEFAARPHLCGRPAVAVPDTATPIRATETGYITHIDAEALGRLAEEQGVSLHVAALPGSMMHPARPLLHVDGEVEDEAREAMIKAFTIERHRRFDQDPRLGVIALAEIASRALSPAVNDPGTGVEVLNALLRVFLTLRPGVSAEEKGEDEESRVYPVHIGVPSMDDMLADAFGPIIRDGSAQVEVALRLTNTLWALHAALPDERAVIARWAGRHAQRVEDAIEDPNDLADFQDSYKRLWNRG